MDFQRFPIAPGDRVLDLGCGAGRHAFEVARRGGRVVAFDSDADELSGVERMFGAMRLADELPDGASARAVRGNALALPFADGTFDKIIAAEVLEHIPDDMGAMAELARVLRPGGRLAVTVPSWLPERICWALSADYHNAPGGHLRIYTRAEVEAKLGRTGFQVKGHHHAHGLHSPYWWIKCAVGVGNDRHPLAAAYHKLLVWDITERPMVTRLADAALNPVLGKSLVVYSAKPGPTRRRPQPPPSATETAHAAV